MRVLFGLWQVSSAGLPKILLSEVAATKTLYELEVALRTEKGFSVVFTDVSPSVDLHRILSQWEGQFVLNGPFSDGEATARFTSPEAAKEVQLQPHYHLSNLPHATIEALQKHLRCPLGNLHGILYQ